MTAPHLTLEQKGFLELYTIGTWSPNPETGLIDVEGDFNCSKRGLESLNGIRFGHVSGVFSCARNQLATLEGAPQTVGLSFYCGANQLASLEGAPQSVGGNFDCVLNQLASLKGAPQMVGVVFDCSHNQLASLEGAPQMVGGGFYCCDNMLTSLEGAPESVSLFHCGVFRLDDGEWNPAGWLKAAQESKEASKLIVPLLSEDALDDWMRKHPLDLDLLNSFPDIKAGVLKRTGIRDISKLAAARRQGLV